MAKKIIEMQEVMESVNGIIETEKNNEKLIKKLEETIEAAELTEEVMKRLKKEENKKKGLLTRGKEFVGRHKKGFAAAGTLTLIASLILLGGKSKEGEAADNVETQTDVEADE